MADEGMKRRLLYVEDEAPLRELVTGVLEDHGFVVRAVESAEAGLAALQHEPVDVLVTDYTLPAHSGEWLVKEAGARGLLPSGGVWVVTGESAPGGLEGLPVLHKPVDLGVLLSALSAGA
jgi:DNA-binding response OmpR family regulator